MKNLNEKKSLLKKLLLSTGNTIMVTINNNNYELKKVKTKFNDVVMMKSFSNPAISNEYINIDLANYLIEMDSSFTNQPNSIKLKLISILSCSVLIIIFFISLFSLLITKF